MTVKRWVWGGLFWVGLALYTVFSYTLVDPNLVLSSQPKLWSVQQILWQFGYHQRTGLAAVYALIMTGLFGTYAVIMRQLRRGLKLRQAYLIVLGSILILFFSYPALSHDIFNYLMNAKMVRLYQANPHVQTALDFPADPWLKFMHNTHTPAPYGYGFTIVSLIPSYLGQNHLKISMLLFRLLVTGALIGTAIMQAKLSHKQEYWLIPAFLLNPLVLIETVSNIHNDTVMMFLGLLALWLGVKGVSKRSYGLMLTAGLVWILSVSIKYASILILPGALIYFGLKRIKKPVSLGGVMAVVMSLPLITSRSQRFLPWYLIWPLSFTPLIGEKGIRVILMVFSASAMYGYIPYLYTGVYTPQTQLMRTAITFIPPLIAAALMILGRSRQKQDRVIRPLP